MRPQTESRFERFRGVAKVNFPKRMLAYQKHVGIGTKSEIDGGSQYFGCRDPFRCVALGRLPTMPVSHSQLVARLSDRGPG